MTLMGQDPVRSPENESGTTPGIDAQVLAELEQLVSKLRQADALHRKVREKHDSERATQMLKESVKKADIFGRLFGDPAWNIILFLYEQSSRFRNCSISDAASASGAAPTTGLRYIESLIRAGFIEREPDSFDKRRSFVTLSDQGRAALERFFLVTA